MKLNIKITKQDKIQIGLNIIAFFVLISSPGGTGSFWGFLTFNILTATALFEAVLSKQTTGRAIWLTKTITYMFLCAKFSHTIGSIKLEYIVMVIIALTAFLVSRHVIKKRAIALWGQNSANFIGSVMYISAILSHPQAFGISHILFWLINGLSYALWIREILVKKQDRVNLIIPCYAVTMSCILAIIIATR